jgi:hypothetical protein
LEEEGQWGDHEIEGKMPYRGMHPTCSGLGTGRLQQEIRRSGGRRLGGRGPKTGRSAIEDEEEYLTVITKHEVSYCAILYPQVIDHVSRFAAIDLYTGFGW